jgi:uncharacterized protein YjiS (DUF1127 family)
MTTKNPNELGFWRRFVAWRDRVNARIALRNVNDRTLRDIGLSRGNEKFPTPYY